MAEQANPVLVAETNPVARRKLFGRLAQRQPARAVEPFDQGRLDLRLSLAADAATSELGGYHLGVVDHQLVAGLEPSRKVGDSLVAQNTVALDHQHPRGVARAGRAQRDAGGWEFEVEEVGAHGANCRCSSSPRKRGSSTPRLHGSIAIALEYWVARSSRAMTIHVTPPRPAPSAP